MAQARSDVVGSLLRPPRLLEARERFAGGELSTAELKAVEDDAVDGALRLQEDAGVEVVTDGEMRRLELRRDSRRDACKHHDRRCCSRSQKRSGMNEPAEPAMHNHRCSVHGQVMQAPTSFPVTCGKCGRLCVPDTEPA